MATVTLDTYEIVKELRAAGFSDLQAEAVTNAVKRAQNVDLSNTATKADLAELKADLQRWVIQLVLIQSFGLVLAVLGGVAALLRLMQP